MRGEKFHGRFSAGARECQFPGCLDAGEFRAPGHRRASFDGPGEHRWFCLHHVREFNKRYDWFAGMSAEEIWEAQSPLSGWRDETPAFRGDASLHGAPRWSDFADPFDAISARAQGLRREAGQRARDGADRRQRLGARELAALGVMGLDQQAGRQELRRRYSELVRRYHPDRNGGDRRHEVRLQQVVEAYQVLRRADFFS